MVDKEWYMVGSGGGRHGENSVDGIKGYRTTSKHLQGKGECVETFE